VWRKLATIILTMTKQCPVCHSAKTKQFNGSQFKKGVQLFKNRVCEGYSVGLV
jgi:hypothetical protein